MAAYAQIKIQHSPVNSWPGTVQTGFVGAQSVVSQRGSLPSFTDANTYYVSKTGSDSNAGTAAAPFLTLGKAYIPTANKTKDSAGTSTLAEVGTVPTPSWPCRPIPPSGDYVAGPFAAANYFTGPAALRTALSGLTTWALEGWLFVEAIGAVQMIFESTGTVTSQCFVGTDGSLRFSINGTLLASAASAVVAGSWYYFGFTNGAGGKDIFLGTTPETAVSIATAAQGTTTGTIGNIAIGAQVATTSPFTGYLSRLFFSNVQRRTFPTYLYSSAPSNSAPTVTSGVVGAYYFQTLPVAITAYKGYSVVADSEEYNEVFRCNFAYELPATNTTGIYALDGAAPTFRLQKGVFPGTYGAGNSGYVPLTASVLTTCYVAKNGSAGGSRGNPLAPFLTVQQALNATTTAGDTVEIQDSGTYIENLSVPNRNLTIQASAGQVPIIKPSSTTYVFTMVSTSNLSIAGILFIGTQLKGLVFGAGAETFLLQDCELNNFGSIMTNISGSTFTANNCFIDAVPVYGGSASNTVVFYNCFFNSSFSALNLATSFQTMKNCTAKSSITIRSNHHVLSSIFLGGLIFDNTSIATFGILDCEFGVSDSQAGITTAASGSDQSLIYNCIFNGALTSTWAIKSLTTSQAWIYNCSAINFVRGFYYVGTQTNSRAYNLSTLNCSTAGVDAVSSVAAIGLADFGSGVAYQSGVAPTQSISAAAYLSTSTGNENLTLTASSPGAFLVDDNIQIRDAGIQAALFDVTMQGVTINGLTLQGKVNQEGGIASVYPITVAYNTFSGLGPYGILSPASSTLTNNLFNTNGHAIKDGQYSNNINHNAAYSCAGAFLQHYGRATAIDHNTAFSCEYGQYDSLASSFSASSNNIYISSGAFDYSGEDQLTYSDVGTLDPDRANTIDAHSIQTDPLFVNADTGDLTLQAIAREFFWDSPAIGAGSSGTDMGAYIWTYGTISTAWTKIDFGTTNWRNPDTVLRRQLPVKLAEGDMENGAIYSVQATFKKEYEFTWVESTNDMPLAQLDALIAMFLSSTNQIQIDFGAGYIPAFFGRTVGFEYADMTGLYSDDTVPEPLRQMTVREA